MGRGASTSETVAVERTGRPERVSVSVFPTSQLDPEHPIADLWGLVGDLGLVAEEQRCLRDYLLVEPLEIHAEADPTVLLHSQMKPYVGPGGERVMAHPLSRRARLSIGRDVVCLATVGDFVLQGEDGMVRIERRADFKRDFERVEMTPFPQAVVPLAGEIRQALLDGRLNDAFADLRDSGGLERRSLELRSLGETLLLESWKRAAAGGHERELAEEVSDWLGAPAGVDASALSRAALG